MKIFSFALSLDQHYDVDKNDNVLFKTRQTFLKPNSLGSWDLKVDGYSHQNKIG